MNFRCVDKSDKTVHFQLDILMVDDYNRLNKPFKILRCYKNFDVGKNECDVSFTGCMYRTVKTPP